MRRLYHGTADGQENDVVDDNKLPPYALIIAEVLDRPRGGVRVRLTGNSGESIEVEIDDSSVAPMTKDEAAEVSSQRGTVLPG